MAASLLETNPTPSSAIGAVSIGTYPSVDLRSHFRTQVTFYRSHGTFDYLFRLHLQNLESEAGNQSDDANLSSSHAAERTWRKAAMHLIMDIWGSRLEAKCPKLLSSLDLV